MLELFSLLLILSGLLLLKTVEFVYDCIKPTIKEYPQF